MGFNPDQARDEHGRWTGDAGRASAATSADTKPAGTVRYTSQQPPSGKREYLHEGIGYQSLNDLRAAHPGAQIERIPATRANRLFG